jgi:hypothetical protein
MRPQIVRSSIRDLEVDKRAELQLARDEDQAVDFWRVPSRAANGDRLGAACVVFGLELADGFYEHL